MRALSITLVLALVACGGSDDEDGDGFGVPQDCNDRDASVFPGNPEACDGVDNDCDGQTDEDLGDAFFADEDGDGFGTGEQVRSCDGAGGVATVDGDCDDTRGDVNPDAAEDCDSVDRNCDGDPVAGASGNLTYYLDADLDGFGADATGQTSCEPIDGRITEGGDCNDTNDTVHPGADEICDGQDNDCDPATLEDDAIDATTWYPDGDVDGHGASSGSVTACEAPTGDWSEVDDDCDDADPARYPGANELCDGGVDNDCDASTDEADTAVWYPDQDGDTYGSDDPSTWYTGCSPPAGPPTYTQVGGDCDDTEPLVNPVATPNCTWDHCSVNNGNITRSETWRAGQVVHYVDCLVQVRGLQQPVLTVEDGARVEFGPSGGLYVGDGQPGNLVVEGDLQGVTFTSVDKFPQPGDWRGVKLGTGSSGSVSEIRGLTIEYGGDGTGNSAGLWVVGADVEIDRLTAQRNLGEGLRVTGDGAEPYVHDSVLSQNTGNGLTVGFQAGLARQPAGGGSGPTFTDNTVTNNGGRPISIPGSHVDEIDPSSTLAPNGVEEIEVTSGTLKFTGTWFDHGIAYEVAELASVFVEDGPQAVLTIEDGTTVKFNIDADLRVGEFAEGALIIEDGPQGVVFTATDEVIQLSDNWDTVYLGDDADGSVLQNLLIDYGGGNLQGAIVVYNSAPTITDVLVRRSDTNGIYVSGLDAAPLIQDSIIVDNDENGVYVESSSGIARDVAGPTFTNNQLRGNGVSPVVVPPNFVGELDPTTQFSGNGDRVGIHGGTVREDARWQKLDEDYEVRATVDIGGPQSPVVTIDPDNVLFFERDVKFRAGVLADGALRVNPTGGLQVLMTSADSAPGRGDWHGVEIGRNSPPNVTAKQSVLRNLRVEYAGGSDPVADAGYGAVSLRDPDPCATQEPLVFISNLEIYESSKVGLAVNQGMVADIDRLHVDGATEACVGVGGISPVETCNAVLSPVVNPQATELGIVPRGRTFTDVVCENTPEFGAWPIDYIGANCPYNHDVLDDAYNRDGFVFPGPVRIRDLRAVSDAVLTDIGVPYIVERDIAFEYISIPRLSVEPGVEVRFDQLAGVSVGVGSNGSLDLQPGSVLTSNNAVPLPGDWDGITIGRFAGAGQPIDDDCDGTGDRLVPFNITDSLLEYGGGNGAATLYFNQSHLAPQVTDTTIKDSISCGMYFNPRTLTQPDNSNTFINIGGAGNLCYAP